MAGIERLFIMISKVVVYYLKIIKVAHSTVLWCLGCGAGWQKPTPPLQPSNFLRYYGFDGTVVAGNNNFKGIRVVEARRIRDCHCSKA